MKLYRTLSNRFGVTGAARQTIEASVIDGFSEYTLVAPPRYSEVVDEVLAIAGNLSMDIGPCGLPGWDTDRITMVARWGAFLADISGGLNSETEILCEAAAFNVAVASFDTLVDEHRDLLADAVRILHPEQLTKRINGEIDQLAPVGTQDPVRCVVGLFDYALGGVHRTHRDIPNERADLSRLLTEMYNAELGVGDALRAKSLPVVFIGKLGNKSGDREVDQLYESLAHFIAGWDDFIDLFSDWRNSASNEFLQLDTISGFPRLFPVIAGCVRLIFATWSHAQMGHALRARALDSVSKATRCERDHEVISLILTLVRGGI